MEIIIALMLQGHVSLDSKEIFIRESGPIPCTAQEEFHHLCNIESLVLRKRAWKRIKRSLPMTKEMDHWIKQTEQASLISGFNIQ